MSVHDQRSSDGDEDARANRDKQLQAAVALDAQFCKTCYEIEKRLTLLNRHTRLRVRNWLQRLRRLTHNKTWQRCRNEHAALLLLQLQQGRLEPPFDKEPPSGPINNLPLHLKVLLAASRRPKPPPPVPRFIESPQPAPPARSPFACESTGDSERSVSFAVHELPAARGAVGPAAVRRPAAVARAHCGRSCIQSAQLGPDTQRPATAGPACTQPQCRWQDTESRAVSPAPPTERSMSRDAMGDIARDAERARPGSRGGTLKSRGPPRCAPRLGWRGAVLSASTLLSAGGHHRPQSRSPSPAPHTQQTDSSAAPAEPRPAEAACAAETLYSPRRWQEVKETWGWGAAAMHCDSAALRSKVAECQQYLCAAQGRAAATGEHASLASSAASPAHALCVEPTLAAACRHEVSVTPIRRTRTAEQRAATSVADVHARSSRAAEQTPVLGTAASWRHAALRNEPAATHEDTWSQGGCKRGTGELNGVAAGSSAVRCNGQVMCAAQAKPAEARSWSAAAVSCGLSAYTQPSKQCAFAGFVRAVSPPELTRPAPRSVHGGYAATQRETRKVDVWSIGTRLNRDFEPGSGLQRHCAHTPLQPTGPAWTPAFHKPPDLLGGESTLRSTSLTGTEAPVRACTGRSAAVEPTSIASSAKGRTSACGRHHVVDIAETTRALKERLRLMDAALGARSATQCMSSDHENRDANATPELEYMLR